MVAALGKISLSCGPASALLTTETASFMATAVTTDFQATVTMATYINGGSGNINNKSKVLEKVSTILSLSGKT